MRRRAKSDTNERSWRRWSEAEARSELDELARTGETAIGFARRKGVSTQRLAYWRKRLASAAKAEAKPAFVAVTIPPASARSEIEIRVADITVVVQEGCDVELVAHLVDGIWRRTRAC
jgi:hypothetical protein